MTYIRRKSDVSAFSLDDGGNANKLVIIEFKRPGADILENNRALIQSRLYASELADRIETVLEVSPFASLRSTTGSTRT